VDQRAERLGGLAGPDGTRVGLGGVFQVAQGTRSSRTSSSTCRRGRSR
jgi:hypothetical protein